MSTNIEIKARVKDFDKLKKLVEGLCDGPCVTLQQEDTFFNTPRGRLKLRCFSPVHGELIYYERLDATGPKRSDYMISTTTDPDSLKVVLASAWGVRGVVRKERLLYKVANTRIHLDNVERLGTFMELEVVLHPGQSDEQGQATAAGLMEKLGIKHSDLVDVAYIDLLDGSMV